MSVIYDSLGAVINSTAYKCRNKKIYKQTGDMTI